MTFFRHLVSGSEWEVDSVIAIGLVLVGVMVFSTLWVIFWAPSAWNPITFATGGSALITAVAGGKTARDYMTPPRRPFTTASKPDGEE